MNKVVRNYIYNLSYQVLVLIVPLITTPYVSRVLGAKGVGTFSYTNSIVQYFILFGCVGLNLYGQREIAYVQHEKEKRDKVFWELVILNYSFRFAFGVFLFFSLPWNICTYFFHHVSRCIGLDGGHIMVLPRNRRI